MVLLVRLHQSQESVTVFQRDLLAFGRGDKNPKMLEQDRSFSFPVGKGMTARKLHSLSVCVHLGHAAHPTHSAAAGHHCTSGATLGRSTK